MVTCHMCIKYYIRNERPRLRLYLLPVTVATPMHVSVSITDVCHLTIPMLLILSDYVKDIIVTRMGITVYVERGLQEALHMINDTFQSELDNSCVELMENYLCHYYFPLCNLTTGEITPVCRSGCALLLNNQDCAELREITNEQLNQHNVTDST